MTKLTEADIIRHVQMTGRFVSQMKDTPYHAHWKGKSLWAAGTRELVLQICQIEGIAAV